MRWQDLLIALNCCSASYNYANCWIVITIHCKVVITKALNFGPLQHWDVQKDCLVFTIQFVKNCILTKLFYWNVQKIVEEVTITRARWVERYWPGFFTLLLIATTQMAGHWDQHNRVIKLCLEIKIIII